MIVDVVQIEIKKKTKILKFQKLKISNNILYKNKIYYTFINLIMNQLVKVLLLILDEYRKIFIAINK